MRDEPGSGLVKLVIREELLKPRQAGGIFDAGIQTPHGVQTSESVTGVPRIVEQKYCRIVVASPGLDDLHIASGVIALSLQAWYSALNIRIKMPFKLLAPCVHSLNPPVLHHGRQMAVYESSVQGPTATVLMASVAFRWRIRAPGWIPPLDRGCQVAEGKPAHPVTVGPGLAEQAPSSERRGGDAGDTQDARCVAHNPATADGTPCGQYRRASWHGGP
jgi:hypothetical protein